MTSLLPLKNSIKIIFKDTVLLLILDKRKDERELENGLKLKNQNE